MKKIIFLGSIFSNDRYAEIMNNSKGAVANANDTFQKAILAGITQHPNFKEDFDIAILNMPNIGAYPFKYKDVFFKGSSFVEGNISGINLPFVNILYLKHYIKYKKIKSAIKSLLEKSTDNVYIVLYDLYEPYLRAISELKDSYNFKSCVIVPDLLGFTGAPDNILFSCLNRRTKDKVNTALLNIDSFVLLCDSMKYKLPINNRKYIVIEGIYQLGNDIEKKYSTGDENIIIFYSGALDIRNGVLDLLEAFSFINEPNYRLIICGDGSVKNIIQEATSKDSRIVYKGQLPHNEVLKMQVHANLLVNPRQPVEEFTKFSFPSKTMEYLASGTPVLMYRLPGVPDEYFDYCYVLDDLSNKALADKIKYICTLSKEEIQAKGLSAKCFIQENKNSLVQSSKLLDLLFSL